MVDDILVTINNSEEVSISVALDLIVIVVEDD